MSQTLLPEDTERSLSNLTLINYVLFAISLVTALPTGLISVIIAYIKRDEVRGTWLESHFNWLITTFWVSLIGFAAAWVLAFTIIGIPLAVLLGFGAWVWTVYRIVKGFLRFNDRRTVEA